MNHPKNYRGLIHLHEPVTSWPYMFGCMHRGSPGTRVCASSERVSASSGLNSYVALRADLPLVRRRGRGVGGAHREGPRSRSRPSPDGARRRSSAPTYSETGTTRICRTRASRRPAGSASAGTSFATRRAWPGTRTTASRVAPKVRTIRLRNFMEMEPHADNRVTLSERDDPFGRPLPRVHRTTRSTDDRWWPCTTPRARARGSGRRAPRERLLRPRRQRRGVAHHPGCVPSPGDHAHGDGSESPLRPRRPRPRRPQPDLRGARSSRRAAARTRPSRSSPSRSASPRACAASWRPARRSRGVSVRRSQWSAPASASSRRRCRSSRPHRPLRARGVFSAREDDLPQATSATRWSPWSPRPGAHDGDRRLLPGRLSSPRSPRSSRGSPRRGRPGVDL